MERDKIFDSFERESGEFGSKIPNHIKEILHFHQFSSPLILAELDDETIKRLQAFNQSTLPDLLDEEDDFKKMYGPFFYKKPQKFQFLEGEIIILKKFSLYCRHKIAGNNAFPIAPQTDERNLKSGKKIKKCTKKPEKYAENLTEANADLMRMLTECSKKIAEDFIEDNNLRKSYIAKTTSILVSCKVDETNGVLQNKSRCPLCSLDLKVSSFDFFNLFLNSNYRRLKLSNFN